ncbi:hypothetical protein B4096_0785 [Heyndrickxia coagulans]|uniref:Uncharacterized protein n=1 Tax=Heyndrickxia coagulans TaxID=1398 RepID=A0AAN0T9A0_HEYCO|nr:hypothetical protein SB48_HM08orf05560 [Heyndrickxia coagulans]KYC60399.1 hypothetical protein B4100_0812 [Heyndrickxia coagulans]KYC85490.1 hypothetical protein B4096_0785 [Heyndrickxia coagulans]
MIFDKTGYSVAMIRPFYTEKIFRVSAHAAFSRCKFSG